MKHLFALAVLASFAGGASAFASISIETGVVREAIRQMNISPADLINWKVGDEEDFNMSVTMFGTPMPGTMTMSVTKDEGTAVWINQTMNIQGQQDVTEELMNKADGKILKYIHNGQEEQVPAEEKPQIISTDYQTITVPAGTFKALHVVAKTQQVDHMELWANPQAVVMSGLIKAAMPAQTAQITLELASMKHGQ